MKESLLETEVTPHQRCLAHIELAEAGIEVYDLPLNPPRRRTFRRLRQRSIGALALCAMVLVGSHLVPQPSPQLAVHTPLTNSNNGYTAYASFQPADMYSGAMALYEVRATY